MYFKFLCFIIILLNKGFTVSKNAKNTFLYSSDSNIIQYNHKFTLNNDLKCIALTAELMSFIYLKYFPDNYEYMRSMILYSSKGINDIGNQYSCKNLNHNKSKYFHLTYTTPYSVINFGLCYFKECSESFFNENKKYLEIIIKNVLKINLDLNYINFIDHDKELERKRNSYFSSLIIISLIIGAIVLMYIINFFMFYVFENYTYNSNLRNNLVYNDSNFSIFVKNFDLFKNIKKILSVRLESNDPLRIFDGIRFFSAGWVVFGHTFFASFQSGFINILDIQSISTSFWSPLLYSAFFSVDVFFYMAAFMLYLGMQKYYNKDYKKTYNNIKVVEFNTVNPQKRSSINSDKVICNSDQINLKTNLLKDDYKLKSKSKSKFTILGSGILFRYIRLLPLYLFCIFGITSYSNFFNEGKIITVQSVMNDDCYSSFWSNLLYVNNIFNIEKKCSAHTWYLANDMQFFVLFWTIFTLLSNYKLIRNIIVFGIFLFSVIISEVISIKEKYNYNDMIHFVQPINFFTVFYAKPYIRVSPYILGLYFCEFYINSKAYTNNFKNFSTNDNNIIKKINNHIETNNITSTLLLIVALFLINSTFFLSYVTNNYFIKINIQTIFLTFNKILFVFGVGLIVHLTFLGKFRFIYNMLSINFFNIIGKLTYGIYIVHLYLLFWSFSSVGILSYIDGFYLSIFSVGVFILATICAFIMSLLFECPIIGLLKVYLGKGE